MPGMLKAVGGHVYKLDVDVEVIVIEDVHLGDGGLREHVQFRVVSRALLDGALQDGALPDGALPDGALPDGALPDGALPDGALPVGALPDGALQDGALPDGALPDGVLPDGALPDGALPVGALPDGALPDGALSDGALPDGALPAGAQPAGALPERAAPGLLSTDRAACAAVAARHHRRLSLRCPRTRPCPPPAPHAELSVPRGDFCNIFPYHVVFDARLVVVQCGARIDEMFGGSSFVSECLSEHFTLVHPAMPFTFANIQQFINAIYIVQHKPRRTPSGADRQLRDSDILLRGIGRPQSYS